MARALLVAGLGFGDEGKGTIVDYLCAKKDAHLVVRYNGGAQAAHNVVTPHGEHHTFSQIGSGMFQGAETYLSRFMFIDPMALAVEIKAFAKFAVYVPDFLHIDKRATIITPYHRAANRIRETLRGSGKHGSCGVGVGEARRDELDGLKIEFGNRCGTQNLEKLRAIQDKKMSELPEDWAERACPEDVELLKTSPKDVLKSYSSHGSYRYHEVDEGFLHTAMKKGVTVFEGAQGVLLDEDYGFYPYNSWTNTTFANAETLLKEVAFNGLVEKYGVLRTYMTRHGAGPMPTEGMLSVPAEPWDHLKQPKVEHNSTGPWQGNFRTGHLDLVALKYAIDVIGKVNYLALTHTDCTPKYLVNEYDGLKLDGIKRTPELMELLTKELFKAKPKALLDFDPTLIEIVLGAPVAIKSFGPTCREKWERW